VSGEEGEGPIALFLFLQGFIKFKIRSQNDHWYDLKIIPYSLVEYCGQIIVIFHQRKGKLSWTRFQRVIVDNVLNVANVLNAVSYINVNNLPTPAHDKDLRSKA
jgi:predicted transcriptional regulator